MSKKVKFAMGNKVFMTPLCDDLSSKSSIEWDIHQLKEYEVELDDCRTFFFYDRDEVIKMFHKHGIKVFQQYDDKPQ